MFILYVIFFHQSYYLAHKLFSFLLLLSHFSIILNYYFHYICHH